MAITCGTRPEPAPLHGAAYHTNVDGWLTPDLS